MRAATQGLYEMHERAVAPTTPRATDPDVLDAMALLASHSGLVVHVIAPRGPGLLQRAHEVADRAGLDVQADLLPRTLRVRFSR